MKISALGSVYGRENPSSLGQCLESLTRQTRPADEVVLVVDGPVNDALESVIDRYRDSLPLRTVPLQQHSGLGVALNTGLACCSNDLVARFDTDDVSMPSRFQQQHLQFAAAADLDLCGSYVVEFADDPASPAGRLRRVPLDHDRIVSRAWFRNPFNHPSVMFRLARARQWGGYVEQPFFEDFLTWQQWIRRGARTLNLAEPLVRMRIGAGFIGRRGGLTYLRHEVEAARYMVRAGLASRAQCAVFLLSRLPARLAPHRARHWLYRALRSAPAARE